MPEKSEAEKVQDVFDERVAQLLRNHELEIDVREEANKRVHGLLEDQRKELLAQNEGLLGAVGRLYAENEGLKRKVTELQEQYTGIRRDAELEITRLKIEIDQLQSKKKK